MQRSAFCSVEFKNERSRLTVIDARYNYTLDRIFGKIRKNARSLRIAFPFTLGNICKLIRDKLPYYSLVSCDKCKERTIVV